MKMRQEVGKDFVPAGYTVILIWSCASAAMRAKFSGMARRRMQLVSAPEATSLLVQQPVSERRASLQPMPLLATMEAMAPVMKGIILIIINGNSFYFLLLLFFV